MVLHAATSPVPWSAALVRWHGMPPPAALVRLRQGARESRQPRRAVWVSAVAQAAEPGSNSSRDSMDEEQPGASTSLPTAAARELNRTQRLRGWHVSTHDQKWRDRLWELKQFVADHGRLPSQTEGRLGSWVHNQRKAYAARQQGKPCSNKMTEERAAALEAVPGWSWDPLEDQWQERYQQLWEFVEQHGGLPYAKEGELGTWVSSQRTAYAAWQRGKPRGNKMTEERIAALEVVPGWSWVPWEDQWQQMYQQLRAFVEQHGWLPLTTEGELGNWVHSQRSAYAAWQQGKPGTMKMTEERIAALEAVPGWTWDAQEARWQEMYQQLRTFVEQHGRLPKRREGELGTWVYNQRTAHRAFLQGAIDFRRLRGMTAERAEALAAVPGWMEAL